MTWDQWPLESEPSPHAHLWQPPHQQRTPDNQTLIDTPAESSEPSTDIDPAPVVSGELWMPGDELDLTSMDFTAEHGLGDTDGSME